MISQSSSSTTSCESTIAVFGDTTDELLAEGLEDHHPKKYLERIGYPRLDEWIRNTLGIVTKPKQPEVEIEAEDDQQVMKEAARSQQMSNGSSVAAANWIGRLSYQWFCMEEKLRVLHDLYPSFEEVPLYLEIIREVNRRWKTLAPKRKQHYIDIATYQYEKKFGSASSLDDFKL